MLLRDRITLGKSVLGITVATLTVAGVVTVAVTDSTSIDKASRHAAADAGQPPTLSPDAGQSAALLAEAGGAQALRQQPFAEPRAQRDPAAPVAQPVLTARGTAAYAGTARPTTPPAPAPDRATSLTRPVSFAAAPGGTPKSIARTMVASYGWDDGQYRCLVSLWERESGWNVHATNPATGAYGIPQALPGAKMAGAGPDWRNNARTQITWGLRYIKSRYATPCGAWGHFLATNWY